MNRTTKIFCLIVGMAILLPVGVWVYQQQVRNGAPLLLIREVVVTATPKPTARPLVLLAPATREILEDKREVLNPSFQAEMERINTLLASESMFNWWNFTLVLIIAALLGLGEDYAERKGRMVRVSKYFESISPRKGCVILIVMSCVVMGIAITIGFTVGVGGPVHDRYETAHASTLYPNDPIWIMDRLKGEVYILAPTDFDTLVSATVQSSVATFEYLDDKKAVHYRSYNFKGMKPDWLVVLVDRRDGTRIISTSCQNGT